jgi:hypothetical protein|tara:strand:+ start:166 stop:390 length:225 start_codon:yes stop_codon:yes gene_type:complete
MIELTDTFYMIWGVCGLGMFLSFILGKKAGYNKMHSQIATSLIDIELERAKVQIMKSEISKVQDELAQTIEDNE